MVPPTATRTGVGRTGGSTVRTVTTAHDAASLPALDRPRDDGLLRESRAGDHRFTCAEGPFRAYERRLEPDGDRVVEHVEYDLAIPGWSWVFHLPIRHLLRHPRPGAAWWMPPDRFSAQTSTALACLAAFTLIAGYTGTLIGQTIAFAADDFGASDRAQGIVLACTRAGVLLALAAGALADRYGRRTLIRATAHAVCVLTATGALAPSLAVLGGSQTIARGLSTGLALLIAILAAEVVPRNSRAWTVSILALTGALGSGMAVWLLPLADLGDAAWRLLYLVPLVGIPFTSRVIRSLPESDRFVSALERPPARAHPGRFWLLAASAFLGLVFAAPASQFLNDFLKDDLGYSAARISAFTLLTNTPAFIGIVVGGRLADRRGRRIVGAVAMAGGVVLTVGMYLSDGWSLWALSIAGGIVGAAAVPALGVYGPELFATTARGRANGLISTLGVIGSAVGLLIVGSLSDRGGGVGEAMPYVAVGPLLLAVLILVAYPETAHQELEDLNPEDR